MGAWARREGIYLPGPDRAKTTTAAGKDMPGRLTAAPQQPPAPSGPQQLDLFA